MVALVRNKLIGPTSNVIIAGSLDADHVKLNNNINLFHTTGLFLDPLKTSENLWFTDVFRGYRKRLVT